MALPLAAHDMWIEPSSFRPPAGSTLEVELRLGDDPAAAERVARNPRRIVRFVVAQGDAIRDVPGFAGRTPAGLLRLEGAGLFVLGFQSHPSAIELAAAPFEAHLAEEGLERVIALRRQRGASGEGGRERFSRHLKSLVAVGPPRPQDGDRALGLPLELIAEDNPYLLAPGAPLSLRLLFAGEGVAGVLVEAVRPADPAKRLAARTDAEGRVSFPLERAGPWLVTAVHMVEAPEGSGADWESFWASLTFELPDSP